MKIRCRFFLLTALSIVLISISFYSCSIFSSVGNSIAKGYENTVTYFNCYYNAQRLMSDAEDEIEQDTMAARARGPIIDRTTKIPGSAKQKFDKVIDKCSNILSLHETSGLVDDALFLIGKSYYYQGEYLKSARKFEELLVQFPNSSIKLEAQLWLAKLKEKLNQYPEGIALTEEIGVDATKKKDKDILVQSYRLLASMYITTNQFDKAEAAYGKALSISTNKETRGYILIALGDLFLLGGKYEKAIESYLNSKEYTEELYAIYYSTIQTSIAYRKLGKIEEALSTVNQLIDDFRFKDFLPALLYERANNYYEAGKLTEAIDEYIYIDTTYKRTHYATRSAYHLGKIYEKDLPDYSLALNYYSEVNASQPIQDIIDGKSKYAIFKRYFEINKKFGQTDSILNIINDSTYLRDSTINAEQHDLIENDTKIKDVDSPHQKTINDMDIPPVLDKGKKIYRRNTLLSKVDSSDNQSNTKINNQKLKISKLNVDSLKKIQSTYAQEIGDIFYSDLVIPDSAYYWYIKSINIYYDSISMPRILYILADLAKSYPDKNFLSPYDYYARLEKDFPASIYTIELGRILGKKTAVSNVNIVEKQYIEAEQLLEKKQYTDAILKFHNVYKNNPSSPYAVKSKYAIGWVYENYLNKPDSAKTYYRLVSQLYPNSIYANNLSKKILDTVKVQNIQNNQVSNKPTAIKDTNSMNEPKILKDATDMELEEPVPQLDDSIKE